MISWRVAVVVLVVALISLSGLGLSQEDGKPAYYLNDDSTSIISAALKKPITYVKMMPDTAPEYVPRSRLQKFDNRQFHFIEVSPDNKQIVFSLGEGDEWMGLLVPDQRYMKFLLYSVGTRFFGVHWTPDSRNLALAMKISDRRYVIQIIRPPLKLESRYEPLNAWQMITKNGEHLTVDGWKISGADTTFSFVVTDSTWSNPDTVSLPLRRPPQPTEN